MLRLNRFEEPYSVRLRIEGVLAAEYVPDVEQAWGRALAIANGRKLLLDASGITRVDEAGVAFLRRLHGSGIKVDDGGRYLQQGNLGGALTRIRQQLCIALCALVPTLHRCPCGQRL